MTKFLTTSGVSYHLENLINNANEKLILISPYLKVCDKLKQLLEDKDRSKIDIRLIYGKSELQPSEKNWLKSLRSIRSGVCENLHAKCYLSENEAIITSMNLYEYSQINNNEMGVYINRDDDPAIYNEILNESMRLVRVSNETESKAPEESRGNGKAKKQAVSSTGYCIRCGTEIKLKPLSPYCRKCYKIWKEKEHENENFEENYCHICGRPNNSSLIKPGCWDCYTKYMYDLEFPLG